MSITGLYNNPTAATPSPTPQPGMIDKGKDFLKGKWGKGLMWGGGIAGGVMAVPSIANLFGADVGGAKQREADNAARAAIAGAPESYAGEADIMERSNSTMTDILRQRAGNPYQSDLSEMMQQLNLSAIEQHALQAMQPQAPSTNPLESFLRQAGVWPE